MAEENYTQLEKKLLEGHWISPNNFLRAKEEATQYNRSIFSVIIKRKFISEEDLFRFFALEAKVDYVDLNSYYIREEIAGLLPEEFCRQNVLLPFWQKGNLLYVAMVNPLDPELILQISESTGYDVASFFACPSAIIKKINMCFGFDENLLAAQEYIFSHQPLNKFPFYRESQRLALSLPVVLELKDNLLAFKKSPYLECKTVDISQSGKAMGILTPLYIPIGIKLILHFSSLPELAEDKIESEVVSSRMQERNNYHIGVMLDQKQQKAIKYIIDKAKKY